MSLLYLQDYVQEQEVVGDLLSNSVIIVLMVFDE